MPLFVQNFKFNHEGELELSAAKVGFAVGSCSLDSAVRFDSFASCDGR